MSSWQRFCRLGVYGEAGALFAFDKASSKIVTVGRYCPRPFWKHAGGALAVVWTVKSSGARRLTRGSIGISTRENGVLQAGTAPIPTVNVRECSCDPKHS